jgi:hypothetical protein
MDQRLWRRRDGAAGGAVPHPDGAAGGVGTGSGSGGGVGKMSSDTVQLLKRGVAEENVGGSKEVPGYGNLIPNSDVERSRPT